MRLSGMETGQMFLEIEVITARTEIRSKLRDRRGNSLFVENRAHMSASTSRIRIGNGIALNSSMARKKCLNSSPFHSV